MTQFVEQLRNQAKWYAQPGHNARDLMDSRLLAKAADELECLHAKIEQMEKQGPVGKFIQHPSNGLWEQDGYGDNPDARPLYALPGAQPAPSVPDSIIADAARYQFLRNGGAYLEPNEGEIYMATDYGAKYYKDLRDLDMDIDEAIAAPPETKP